MQFPRLIKVACPQCGAGLRIEPQATFVTCAYCQHSSFIHIPNRADPPAPHGTQNYGHIHVSEAKPKNAAAAALGVVILSLVFVLGGVLTALAVFATPNRPPPPPPAFRDSSANTGSNACDKAVACCKALLIGAPGDQPQNLRACEGLRALPDDACSRQHKTFRDSAKQLGQTCD